MEVVLLYKRSKKTRIIAGIVVVVLAIAMVLTMVLPAVL